MGLQSNGNILVWGSNNYGQNAVPVLPGGVVYVAIAAGNYHCMALRSDGVVVCWGGGTLDTGVIPDFGQSIVPDGLSGVVDISAGGNHSLAIRP
jgi:alpha-tubulin suppressor-like RCC1 family protein